MVWPRRAAKEYDSALTKSPLFSSSRLIAGSPPVLLSIVEYHRIP